MYIERLFTSPQSGEVIFPQIQIFTPTSTIQSNVFPDRISLARHILMLPDQTVEIPSLPTLENQPAVLLQTNEALSDLYNQAVFQRNGILAGTCLRIQQETTEAAPKVDAPVASFIKSAARDQVDPRDQLGQSFRDKQYGDNISLVYALANLKQVTGALETDSPEADQKMTEQFRYLNDQLFDLNRAGGRETVLEDLRLAFLLKLAFPEQTESIDVSDIHYGKGGVMKGHAKEIAHEYFSRAVSGQLFSVPGIDKRQLAINPDRTILTEYTPFYQTELATGFQINLGSENLAAVSILRFLAEFDPNFLQSTGFNSQILDQAQDDLIRYRNKHPDVFSDPQFVLLYGEHLSNIQTVRKQVAKSKAGSNYTAKSA